MKIMFVIGSRPEIIKAGVICREIKKIDLILVHTGQHYDTNMSDIFFDELNLTKPNYNLGIGSFSQGKQTGKMLIELEKLMLKEKPDKVLVYGDTNSTLAGVLAANKLHITTAHIEAGMRSFDKTMPEEMNRIIADHCSDILFCPTKQAVLNLKREGITKNIHLVGDVSLDSILYNLRIAKKKSNIISRLNLKEPFFVATIHRQSNADNKERLENIFNALSKLNKKVIVPLHPRTKKNITKFGILKKWRNSNVQIIEPVGFLDFLKLMSKSSLILTDSGGIQKEALILKIPCVTLRENTEWTETVETGYNILAGFTTKRILASVNPMINKNLKDIKSPYGEGNTAKKIAHILSK